MNTSNTQISLEKKTGKKNKALMSKRKKMKNKQFHIMIIPGIIFLLIFNYLPMLGLVMAFQNYVPARGIMGSDFVGLQHFRYMLALPNITRVFTNTVVIATGKIFFNTILAIIFAILLNEIRVRWIKKSVQTVVYLPNFLSWVVLSAVVVNMFNLDGSVNQILTSLGLEPLNFLGSNQYFRPLLIGTDVWKSFGFNSIVYLAAITSIDPLLHEAASIDGANWWRRIWHITLPGMLPIILLLAILSLPNILDGGFDQIYNLYSPMVYETGDIIDTYVYRVGLMGREYSFGTAVGLLRSIIGLVLILSANNAAKKFTDRKLF